MFPPTFAFTGSCPDPPEGQASTCQDVILHYETPPEDTATIAYLQAAEFMAYRSMSIMAPLYLFLLAAGIFRRYIIGRI